jgi:hypothetical protein
VQKKLNMLLAGAVLFFCSALLVGWKVDILLYEGWRKPDSWQNRKQINAQLRAQEAAAAKENLSE